MDCLSNEVRDTDDELLRSEFSSNANHPRLENATPLHYACMSNKPEMVKIICPLSNDFNTKDYYDKIPLEYIDSSTCEGVETLKIYHNACKVWDQKRVLFGEGKISFFVACGMYQDLHHNLQVTLGVAAKVIFQKDFALFET